MLGWFKRLHNKIKKDPPEPVVKFGERDADGYASVYIDGKDTHVRIHIFTKEQIDEYQVILNKLYTKEEDDESN